MKTNEESLQNSLMEFGLSEKEAKVYLVALGLGATTILKLTRLSGLKRPTVYTIVESLTKKGLFSIEIFGLKKTYRAENPNRLEVIFDQKKQELTRNLPILQDLYLKDKSDSFIRYYEGLEAVKLVYEEILETVNSGDDYMVIGNQEEWLSLDKKFFIKFIEKRAKLNLNIRLLFQDSNIAREHQKFEKNYNEKIKVLPPETTLTTNLVITSDRVIIHQLTNPISAIVIQNKNVARMNKEMFEIMWKATA